ncbi:hypothetical protein G7046_g1386 [Stylonectria norvegica]|nr:hypothetical protein G7046_g1386 [Stylonectria norvegica]
MINESFRTHLPDRTLSFDSNIDGCLAGDALTIRRQQKIKTFGDPKAPFTYQICFNESCPYLSLKVKKLTGDGTLKMSWDPQGTRTPLEINLISRPASLLEWPDIAPRVLAVGVRAQEERVWRLHLRLCVSAEVHWWGLGPLLVFTVVTGLARLVKLQDPSVILCAISLSETSFIALIPSEVLKEPSLPPLLAVAWDEQSQSFSHNPRKRVRAQGSNNAPPQAYNSSDPAFFSSDDDPALDNYVEGRRKKRYIGSWFQQHPELPERGSGEGMSETPAIKQKRQWARHADSGVYLGSDGNESDDMMDQLESPMRPKLPQLGRPDAPRISMAEFAAQDKVRTCLERGEETVDFWSMGLQEISNDTISPLSHLSRIPFVTKDVAFEHKDPELKIYLAMNSLTRVPGAIFDLTHLTTLSLRGNKLTEIPPAISKLHRLKELNVSQNRLRYLPIELLDLFGLNSSLRTLVIHPNPLLQPELDLETRAGSDSEVSLAPDLQNALFDLSDLSRDKLERLLTPVLVSRSLGRSPVQLSNTSGRVISDFRLPLESTQLVSVETFKNDERSPSSHLTSHNAPDKRRSRISSSGVPSSVPSLLEIALQTCYRSVQLPDMKHYLPGELVRLNQFLDRAVKQKAAGKLNSLVFANMDREGRVDEELFNLTLSPSHKPIFTSKRAATMSAKRVAPLVFPAASRHTATVIFVHGLGDTGHGWASAVENWRRRQRLDEVKFILPHAPQIPITCNMGMRMPGWFDIKVLDGTVEALRANEDAEGIKLSQQYFHNLIRDEINAGIPADRIVLGGFSQGGAMSIFAGLTCPSKLAGIVGLSSWLLLSNRFKDLVPAENVNKETPIFMGHGAEDPLVRTDLGKQSSELLKQLGYAVSWTTYPPSSSPAPLAKDVNCQLRPSSTATLCPSFPPHGWVRVSGDVSHSPHLASRAGNSHVANMGLPVYTTTSLASQDQPSQQQTQQQATGAGANTGAGVTRPKTEEEKEADRLYEERMEEEYAKRDGGS